MLWNPLEVLLSGIAIAVLFMSGLQYMWKGKEMDNFNEKILMYGVASLFFGPAIHFIFYYLNLFLMEGTYRNSAYYGDIRDYNLTLLILTKISYVSLLLGYVIFFFAFETNLKRTRYILTAIQFLFIIFIIISPSLDIILPILQTSVFYIIILLMIVLFYYTKYSQLEFKAISAFLFLGAILIGQGLAFSNIVVKELNIVPLIFVPIFIISGSIISIIPTFIDPKHISKSLISWKLIGYISILMQTLILFFYLISRITNFFIIQLITVLVLCYMFYRIINIINTEITGKKFKDKLENKDNSIDFLGMFIKPAKITEEDLLFYKKQKICLVCKGGVGGFNIFVCNNCDALYCERCAKSLTNLENACWFCESPIDESKPVKLTKKEDKTIEKKKSKHKDN